MSQDEALISHYVLSRAAAKAFKPGPGLVRDWELGAIKGCEAKVRFARTSQRYHRLILSPDNRLAVPGGAEETYLEINYAYSLTVAADAAQLGGWRPHGYVRCPDIAYLIHTEPALLPPLDFPLVETTRNVLLTNEYSAVRLEAGHTALALAALLSQLNYVWRFARRKPPTSLSWQFIRAVPGETGTRFWHLFLKTLGASDVAIKEHFLRNDTQFTAQLIAGIISGNEQAQRLGCHEAPDLVVVFGARHLWDEGKSELERQEIPLDVTRVFRAIQAEPVIAMREPFELQIGPARIVFIDDDQTYMNTAYFKSLPSVPELPPLIERLSLFDHGFTLQQARYVAGELVHDIVHLKSLLDRAVTRGTIWRHGGSYFVPHALRVDPPPASLELAQTYHALANSLMPGIGRSATSGYGPAECCEVEVAHEAQALLGKALEATDGAKELTKAANDRETSARLSAVELELKCERGLHMRFFELPSWGVLTQLNRNPVCESRRDVLTYAEALLKQAKQYGEIDPRALTTFAQAAAKASFQAWFAGNPGMARSMAERAMEYFDQAKTLADKYSDEQTHDDWLMHVLTWRLAYLEEHNAVASRIKRADRGLSTWMYPKDMIERYQAEALAIAERSDGLGISPDISWYVARADRIEDPAEAGPLYRSAVFRQPTFFGSYLRMFGTLTRDECRRAMLSDPGNNFWRKRLHQVLIWYERNRSRGQTRLTLERLTKGEAEIRRYLGTA